MDMEDYAMELFSELFQRTDNITSTSGMTVLVDRRTDKRSVLELTNIRLFIEGRDDIELVVNAHGHLFVDGEQLLDGTIIFDADGIGGSTVTYHAETYETTRDEFIIELSERLSALCRRYIVTR